MKWLRMLVLGTVAALTVLSPVGSTSEVQAFGRHCDCFCVYYRCCDESVWHYYDSFRLHARARMAARHLERCGYVTCID